jgi:hypothetical protein
MNDKPISVGDLVVVVRGCECGKTPNIGLTFTVEGIDVAYSHFCQRCGADMSDGRLLAYGHRPGRKHGGYVPVLWLRKIPPLADPATETTDEGIAA